MAAECRLLHFVILILTISLFCFSTDCEIGICLNFRSDVTKTYIELGDSESRRW